MRLFSRFSMPPDEPARREEFLHRGQRLWPRVAVYRLVEYPERGINRVGVQGQFGDTWVDLVQYDPGYDEYGKLQAGRWKAVRADERTMRVLLRELRGEPEPVRILA